MADRRSKRRSRKSNAKKSKLNRRRHKIVGGAEDTTEDQIIKDFASNIHSIALVDVTDKDSKVSIQIGETNDPEKDEPAYNFLQQHHKKIHDYFSGKWLQYTPDRNRRPTSIHVYRREQVPGKADRKLKTFFNVTPNYPIELYFKDGIYLHESTPNIWNILIIGSQKHIKHLYIIGADEISIADEQKSYVLVIYKKIQLNNANDLIQTICSANVYNIIDFMSKLTSEPYSQVSTV